MVHHKSAGLTEGAGLKVVMNGCPKFEPFRPFRNPGLHLWI